MACVDGVTENLTWDVEQRLSSIAGPSGATSFTYDAGGARLMRETPTGRTLYIDGHEITAAAAGTTVTATRSYGFGGRTVATRTPAGLSYLVADQQGSVEASVTGGTIDVARTYDPYGDRRTGGELDTDQGWIGQIEDDTTDLAYLNARYYDPNIGTFISADPVYDTSRPQTLNPYNYAMSNPTSLSDPSGLDPPWAWGRPDIKKPPLYFQLSYGNTNTGKAIQWAHKATGQSIRHTYDNWQAGYSARVKHRRDQQALSGLARANPDPGFWRALAAAGSGEALTLTGMRITNPDPGFWKAVAQAGDGLRKIGLAIGQAIKAAIENSIYYIGAGGADPSTADTFSPMNPTEREWCAVPSHLGLCLDGIPIAVISFDIAADQFPDQPGQRNAFRHCLWAGTMRAKYDTETAQGFLDRHEAGEWGRDHDADLFNNAAGMDIGRHADDWTDIYELCSGYTVSGALDIGGGQNE